MLIPRWSAIMLKKKTKVLYEYISCVSCSSFPASSFLISGILVQTLCRRITFLDLLCAVVFTLISGYWLFVQTLGTITDSYRTHGFELSRVISQYQHTQQDLRDLRYACTSDDEFYDMSSCHITCDLTFLLNVHILERKRSSLNNVTVLEMSVWLFQEVRFFWDLNYPKWSLESTLTLLLLYSTPTCHLKKKNGMLKLDTASFCSRNMLDSSRHGFHNVLEIFLLWFWSRLTWLYGVIRVRPCCRSQSMTSWMCSTVFSSGVRECASKVHRTQHQTMEPVCS